MEWMQVQLAGHGLMQMEMLFSLPQAAAGWGLHQGFSFCSTSQKHHKELELLTVHDHHLRATRDLAGQVSKRRWRKKGGGRARVN